MIGYVKGKVTGIFIDFCFVETGGIGYRIFISDKTRQKLTYGEEAKLLTYMAVREDAIHLYGFWNQEEYDLFILLISISKIGPKVGMGILSAIEPSRFIGAVQAQNVTLLTKLPGIGKKTAERLMVELKDKVSKLSGTVETVEVESPKAVGVMGEAAKALTSLGYDSSEITPILKRLGSAYTDVSSLVGAALRELAKGNG